MGVGVSYALYLGTYKRGAPVLWAFLMGIVQSLVPYPGAEHSRTGSEYPGDL